MEAGEGEGEYERDRERERERELEGLREALQLLVRRLLTARMQPLRCGNQPIYLYALTERMTQPLCLNIR